MNGANKYMNNGNRTNQILDAACSLFAVEGFDSVSVRKIAEYCNCSSALIIKIFKSKDEIYEALFKEWEEMTLEPLIKKVPEGNPITALENVINLLATGQDERKAYRKNLASAVTTRLSYKDRHKQVLAKQQDVESEIFIPLLTKAKEEGLLNSDDINSLARIIWDATAGARIIETLFPSAKRITLSHIKKYIMKL